jgi:hypothetical protein
MNRLSWTDLEFHQW